MLLSLELDLNQLKDDEVYQYLVRNNFTFMKFCYEQLFNLKQDDNYLTLSNYEINELCINIYYMSVREYLLLIANTEENYRFIYGNEELVRLYFDIRDNIPNDTLKGNIREFIRDSATSFFLDKRPYAYDGWYVIPNEKLGKLLIEDKKFLLDTTTDFFFYVLKLLRSALNHDDDLQLDVKRF